MEISGSARLPILSAASFEFALFLFGRACGLSRRASRRAVTFVRRGQSRSRLCVPSLPANRRMYGKKLQREIRSAENQSLSLYLPLFLPARPYRRRVRTIIHDPFRLRLTCSAGSGRNMRWKPWKGAGVQMSCEFCDLFPDPQINLAKTSQTEKRDEVLCLEPACLTPGTSFVCVRSGGAGLQAHNPERAIKLKSPQPVLALYDSSMAALLWGRQADDEMMICWCIMR